jgi:hypothetical protein
MFLSKIRLCLASLPGSIQEGICSFKIQELPLFFLPRTSMIFCFGSARIAGFVLLIVHDFLLFLGKERGYSLLDPLVQVPWVEALKGVLGGIVFFDEGARLTVELQVALRKVSLLDCSGRIHAAEVQRGYIKGFCIDFQPEELLLSACGIGKVNPFYLDDLKIGITEQV